jgi:hypothetical protein
MGLWIEDEGSRLVFSIRYTYDFADGCPEEPRDHRARAGDSSCLISQQRHSGVATQLVPKTADGRSVGTIREFEWHVRFEWSPGPARLGAYRLPDEQSVKLFGGVGNGRYSTAHDVTSKMLLGKSCDQRLNSARGDCGAVCIRPNRYASTSELGAPAYVFAALRRFRDAQARAGLPASLRPRG